VTPVGFRPAGGVSALSVAARCGTLAIEDQIDRKPVGRKLASGEPAHEALRRHDTCSLSRVSAAFVNMTTALGLFVVRLGLGNAGHEQGLVVLSRRRDGGDGAMQGEEVATPADRERALGAALANADDAGAVSQMRRAS
jgi:hypothetical protein